MKELKDRNIPYKIYLTEDEMPKYWYNVRADMTNKPAPLLNPGTLKPMTAEELGGVFCAELVKQAISYNRLWKQLIDHGLSKTDMMHRAKISTNVLARLSKGEPVSMDSMEKICTMLGCNIGDVMEFIPDTENGGIDA